MNCNNKTTIIKLNGCTSNAPPVLCEEIIDTDRFGHPYIKDGVPGMDIDGVFTPFESYVLLNSETDD